MEFDEIMVMLLRSCNKRFTETVSLSEKLLDCVTKEYRYPENTIWICDVRF